MDELSELFTPSKIGNMPVSNRVIMAPMYTQLADEGGAVSDRLCTYYDRRAGGGMGLIIVENTVVAPGGESSLREIAIYHDRFIPGLMRLADIIHRRGVKAAIQLHHAGRQRSALLGQPVAPSPIACRFVKSQPRELTTTEADELIEAYAMGALRAKQAGFDAVEFHGAHGYLICQFLSAYTNKRNDRYGGSLENRMRFALDIVRRTRGLVGKDYPILFRISAKEFVPGGLDLDETKIIAKELENAGADCIDVSAGNYETGQWSCQPGWMPRGCLVPLAEEIRKGLHVPVIVAGRIVEPRMANRILAEGKVDFVALGRPFLADPEILLKARSGRYEDIRLCVACCHCMDSLMRAEPISCSINAEVGREGQAMVPAGRSKKVVVVGGGPAGLEAARVAALRGHRVILYEKDDKPGGQLLLAAVPPGKEELNSIIEYLTAQVYKAGVDVRLGRAVGVEEIISMQPDAVIIATGSETVLPEFSGTGKVDILLAREVIAGKGRTGKKIVVAGGGRVGCETAMLLAREGKDVTLVRISGKGRLAGELGPASRASFLEELTKSGVKIMADAVLKGMDDSGLSIERSGVITHIKVDTLVISPMPRSDDSLAAALKDRIPEIYTVGDCIRPRQIVDAIREGYLTAAEI